MANEKYEEVVSVLNKILEFNPYLDDVWVLKGSTLQVLKDYDGAIKCYDEALKLNPTNTKAQLGKSSIETGLKIRPPIKPQVGLDLMAITRKIKTLVHNKLKDDPLFQAKFNVSKGEGI